MKRRPITHFDDVVGYVADMFSDGNLLAADDRLPCGKLLEDALREMVAQVDRASLDGVGRATVEAAGEIVARWERGDALVDGGRPFAGSTVGAAFAAPGMSPAA